MCFDSFGRGRTNEDKRMVGTSIQGKDPQLSEIGLELAYQRVGFSMLSSLMVSALVVLALWPLVAGQTLVTWLAVLWGILALRYATAKHFLKLNRGGDRGVSSGRWMIAYVVGAVATGLCWGLTVFYFPQSALDQTTVLLVFVIAGVSSFASATMATVPLASNLFMVSALLPIALWLFSFNQRLLHLMALIAVVYLGLMLLLSRHLQRSVLSSRVAAEQNRELTLVAQEGELRYRSQSNLLRSVLESAADVSVWALDRDYRYLMFNAKYQHNIKRLRGVDIAVGMSALDIIEREELRAVCRQKYDRILEGHSIAIESREEVIQGDGLTYEYYEDHGSPIRNDGGEVVGLTFMTLDITERRRMANQLADSHNFLNTVINSISDQISVKDSEHRWVLLNDVCCNLIGHPREVLLGKSDYDFLPKEQADVFWEKDNLVFMSGEVNVNEEVITSAAGSTRHLLTQKSPFTFSDGKRYVVATSRDITERKQMESELKRREQDFRSLAGNLPDNIARWDVAGRYLYVNPVHERLLGQPMDELLGQPVPDSHDQVRAAIAQVVATGQRLEGLRQPVVVNGVVELHDVTVLPEFDEAGHLVSVLGLGRDMTHIYRMQDEITAREQDLRALAESTPVMLGSFYARPDGSICMPYVSRRIEDLFGLQPEDVVNDAAALLALNHPDDAQRVVNSIAESARSMSTWHEEYRIVHPQFGERWMESNTHPQPHPQGGVIWYGSVHDITERKAMERAVRDSQWMLQEAQRIAHVGSWDVDIAHDKLTWSDEIFRIWEIDKTQFKADFAAFLDTVHPQDRDRVVQAYTDAIQNHSLYEVEHRLLFPDGRVKYILELGEPQYDAQGKPVRFIGSSLDITERKQAEERMALLSNALDQADPAFLMEDYRIVYVNQATCRALEYSEDELIGKHIEEIDSHLSPELAEQIGRALDSSGSFLFESWHRTKRGRTFPVEVSITVMNFGGKSRTLSLARDITERKQAQEALQTSEFLARTRSKLLRAVLESSPEIIVFALDTEYRYQAFNSRHKDTMLAIWGQEIDTGVNMLEVISRPLDREMAQREFDRAFGGESFIEESMYGDDALMRDYWQSIYSPIRSESGEVTGLTCFVLNISNRKRLEEALVAREREFRSLAENSPDAIYRYDRNCRRIYANQTIERLTGLSRETLLGKSPTEFVPNPSINAVQVQQAIQAVLDSGAPGETELQIVTPTGRTAVIHNMLVPEFDADGVVQSVLSIGRDVTERKQAELAVEEARERLQGVLKTIPDLVWLKSVDGVYLACNPTFERFFGAVEADILGKTDYDYVDAELADYFRAKDLQAIESGQLCMNEEWVTFADDQRRALLETRKVPLFDAAGQVVSVLGIGHEITERKQIEDALRDREAFLETLLNAIPTPVFYKDSDGRYLGINRAFETYYGVSREQLVGKSVFDTHPKELAEIYHAKDVEVFQSRGEMQQYESQLKHANGSLRDVFFSKAAFFNTQGKVSGLIGAVVDITERKQGERVLQEKLDEISALNRTLEENAWVLEDQATELEASQVQIRNALEFSEGVINAIPDILFEIDRNGRYLNVWTQNSEILLEQKMALLGKTVYEVFSPENAAIAMEAIQEADAQGLSYGNTIPIVQANGETRWYEHSVAKKHGSGASDTSFIVLSRDITERQRMEDALRLREREFRTLVDSLPDPFFRYDREGRRTYVNAQVERISGKPATELLGQTLSESSLAAPQWNAAMERQIKQVLSTAQALDGEMEYLTADGQTIYYSSRLGPVFDDQGEVSSVMLLLHDVTEIKASELKLKEALEFSEGIINAMPDLLLEVDRQGRHFGIWAQNPELLVTSNAEMLGHTIGDVLSPENAAILMEAIQQAEVFGSSTAQPICIELPQGSRWFEHTVSRKPGGTQANRRFLMLSRDITERKHMEEVLAVREQESRTLIENTPDVITRFDRNCVRIFGNKALDDVIEGGLKAVLGKRPSEVPGGVAGETYESKLREVISTGVNTEFELAWPNKHGLISHSHFRLVAEKDESGAVVSVLAVARDITELNAFREKIHQMAFYDTLTSLPNRALFSDRLRQMLTDAAWHSQHAGVMLLDLDRFKAINDSLGHPAGDALLREAALRLSFCVRGYDTVARLGGDEFAVLLPQIRNADDLGRVAGKILASFNAPFMLEGKEVFITTSIGIAVFPEDSSDADDLVKQADSAMYFAKRSGRNNFRFYSKDLTASAGERLALESELRHAVERKELELYYQPKVRLDNNTLVGSEALLRWNHPQRGMVPPDHFISIAEDSGLIVEIGEWVLRDACATACEWNAQGKPLHKIAVNLSARQFQSNDLVKTVITVLEETGCQHEWIELEITESLLLDESGEVLESLETLRAMGISIAIDDFGTGYSSLSYLARFPITTLKIDRSFIRTVTTEHYRAELVKAILSIARCLGQEVVAEGVETLEQAAFLQANGCQIGQGYLYSMPVPKTAFAAINLNPVLL
jgi:diguanylate cyclase (GGDEF)-like protein/PAS domain S-box-containing protein